MKGKRSTSDQYSGYRGAACPLLSQLHVPLGAIGRPHLYLFLLLPILALALFVSSRLPQSVNASPLNEFTLNATLIATASTTATPNCAPAWEIVDSPNPGSGFDELYGVSAISSDDVWAVGSYSGNTMTLHWN